MAEWLQREVALSFILGLIAVALIALVLHDAFEVMLLPRRVQRRWRFMALYFRVAWPLWTGLVRRWPPPRREAVLSHFGPLSMIGLFSGWGIVLIVGYGMLAYALRPPPGAEGSATSLAEQVYMSGVTFFTLGYGDVVPHSPGGRAVAVLEAGSGIGFIAVVISYLPVLYQLFARREAHVLQLDARAGSPPTATAMLCRHAEAGGLAKLDELLREWEAWGADMLESHLSYPMLVYYRSQHDNQSWLAAVAAVMDGCALILVGVRELPPLQARMTFSMCRQNLIEMARAFQLTPTRYDGGDRLPAEAFAHMIAAFGEAGLDWEGGPEAEATLLALRATYEPLLDAIARYLVLALPGWVPEEGATDHWQRGHRGMLTRRLVEQLSERGEGVFAADPGAGLWRTLRRRLREE